MAEWEEGLFLGTKELRHKADQALRTKAAVTNEWRGTSTTTHAFMASTELVLIFNAAGYRVSKVVSKKFSIFFSLSEFWLSFFLNFNIC